MFYQYLPSQHTFSIHDRYGRFAPYNKSYTVQFAQFYIWLGPTDLNSNFYFGGFDLSYTLF
jgi:hypothetical protein